MARSRCTAFTLPLPHPLSLAPRNAVPRRAAHAYGWPASFGTVRNPVFLIGLLPLVVLVSLVVFSPKNTSSWIRSLPVYFRRKASGVGTTSSVPQMVVTTLPSPTLPREQVAKADTWAVDSVFENVQAFDKEMQDLKVLSDEGWKDVTKWSGKLTSAEGIASCLDAEMILSRRVEKLYTYAHLRHDEDVAEDSNKGRYAMAVGLYTSFGEATSFIDAQLVELDEKAMEEIKVDPRCAKYKFHLEKIWAQKPHTLSPEMEKLMAMSSKSRMAAAKAFRALTDGDMVFGSIRGGDGELHELTHGTYRIHLQSRDRRRREVAFKQYHHHYATHENTLAEMLDGAVQSALFNARARNYKSSLEAALSRNKIPVEVYTNLVETVNKGLKAHHRYVSLRKRLLHYASPQVRKFDLHLYDMYVPVIPEVDMEFDYDEAVELVIESVTPLGKEYQDIARRGFTVERWIDRYENKNKRSGAYSSGCYDTRPFMLMNYRGSPSDLRTLSHEGGHSMNSYLSNKKQPYHYASYSIFVAEVASTFNEALLAKLQYERAKTKEEKMFLIDRELENIRGTFFRQTMFAEFEMLIHATAAENKPLTPGFLKSEYRKLVEKYFGQDTVIDDEIEMEWSRIPHFYSPFYVYQYATGIAAATHLSERVLNGGEKERNDYLKFLEGGCSMYPVDLLKVGGVDMTSPEPVKAVLTKFERLVEQLEDLTKDMVPKKAEG